MSEPIIVGVFHAHIKGYGFTSDHDGRTKYGCDPLLINRLIAEGSKIEERFEEDTRLSRYETYLSGVGHVSIPRGTLTVVAIAQ